MPQNMYRCPQCAAAVRVTAPQAGKLFQCTACKTVFRLGQALDPQASDPEPTYEAGPHSKIGAKTAATVKPALPRLKASAQREEHEEDDPKPSRKSKRRDTAKSTSSGRGLWLLVGIGVAAGVLLLCGGSGVIGLALWLGSSRHPLAQNAPQTSPFLDLPVASKPAGGNPLAGTDASGAGSREGARNPVFDGPLPDITPVPAGATPILVLDPGGHTSTVRSVLFTPDGSRVVSISRDKTARVWDVKTGEVASTIYLPIGPGQEGSFESAAISPDGKRLVLAAVPVGDGKNGYPFYVLSLETGLVEAAIKGNKGYITALAFSRDGSVLGTGSINGDILLFQVPSWRQVAELKGHKGAVRQIAFGPTSSQLVSGSKDGTLRLWNTQEPNPRKVVNAHVEGCNAVVWSADGKTIVSGGVDGVVRFWTEAGDAVHALPFKRDAIVTQITSLDITRDGSKVVFGGIDSTGSVGVIDVAARQRVLEFKDHTNTVMTVAFAPDGKLAVSSGGSNHETFIWKTDDGQVVHRLFGGGKGVWGVGWSPDGTSIAWGNDGHGSTIQAQTPLEYSFRLDTLEQGMAPGANFLRIPRTVGGYTLEALDFFRIQVKQNGKPTVVLTAPRDKERIYSVSLAPGERAIIGGSVGVYLADLRTGKLLREYKGHNFLVASVSPSPDGKYFVTGSADETIRIWRYDRDTPLLSLFFVENEWIAWSPEGYYAASPNGERLMGWQVNNGDDRNALYYPAIQFRASLYQPEVIRLLPSTGSVAAAIAQASRNGRPINSLQLNQVLPPAVAITSPTAVPGGVQANAATVEVKAVARSTGDNPVTAMRLLMDGRPYLGQAGLRTFDAPKLGTVGAVWTVTVLPGRHVFTAQADSTVSKGQSLPVEIVSADNGELPTLYMVAIGVSAYPGKMRLQFGASDAQLLAQTLQQKGNGVFKKNDIHVVVVRDATRARIIKELEWLASVTTPRDVAIVSFSGHGARDDAGNFFLVPVDASPRNIPGTCLPGDLLKQRLAAMPGKVIAMLDCCHSGTVAEDFKIMSPDNLVRDLVTEDYGVVVMCASLGRESALESPATRAGFFTLSMTEGLSGQADFNKDGVVYIHELDYYAKLRVPQLSHGRQHTITGKPPGIRSFPLSRP